MMRRITQLSGVLRGIRRRMFGARDVEARVNNLSNKNRHLRSKAAQYDASRAWWSLLSQHPSLVDQAFPYLFEAKSQLGQDLFALAANGFKRNGYFVEIGASDGLSLSNSWLLEKHFGWRGILVEPSNHPRTARLSDRSARTVKKAVWGETGQLLDFKEVGDYSTLVVADTKRDTPFKERVYVVETISPVDLLATNGVPKTIDFLSLDVEGAELEILRHFPFDEWKVLSIAVEHNFETSKKEAIDQLLRSKGYVNFAPELSSFDAWYVLKDNPYLELSPLA